MTASDPASVLGKLELVDLRDVWTHEAHGFTPWLLQNAEVLGETLGMDLALSAAEHPVGSFALDLIGVDEATGDRVIIENQLTQTDHSHLGQLLTYAAGTDAVNIVWVASRFREEHRAALDWLNNRTDEVTRFFGVEISTVRIGNSPAAPLLRIVAQPNDWGKTVRAKAQAETTTARSQAYQRFWTNFLEELHLRGLPWTSSRKGQAQNWQTLRSGVSGISFSCSFGRSGLCSEIYFQDPDAGINDTRFGAAEAHRQAIEDTYGASLSFEPLVGRKGCRIAEYRPGDIRRAEHWVDYVEWFIAAQKRLRTAMSPVLGGRGQFSAEQPGGDSPVV
ncbi:DUF4268 domain-containing protein [Plantactinospora endophytica]|uniref:DUF4268 domain-containing protein n=1 Tax=Plantactinospora endophytica TaxID=673535 RepID=A0ABQ4EF58_9ACTN|nr:DUF4268 domain-containing protein [Plantactinospora endophytica]GIG93368.1 hypothetical protein Pen02_83040 [Plantactinospora endophytica]